MNSNDTLELARQLERTRNRLDDLWLRPESSEARPEIERQLRRIGDETIRLISANVRAHGETYDRATQALRGANEQLREALDRAERADDAVRAASRAIDLLARVAAFAAA